MNYVRELRDPAGRNRPTEHHQLPPQQQSAGRCRPASRRGSGDNGRVDHPRGIELAAVPAKVSELAVRQHGVLTRRQLHEAGFSKNHVRAGVAARRWQAFGRNVVVLHNAALTPAQRNWTAVLLGHPPVALAGLSAAAEAGLTGFDEATVHIVVSRDSQADYPAWIAVHNSRRFAPTEMASGSGPPRTSPARSVIDAASWQPFPRRAIAILCAAVQQGICPATTLAAELQRAGSIRHVAIMRDILGDIADGAHTLDELDLGPLARRAGLPAPNRQCVRREAGGKRRYVDAEFDLPDGQRLVVEVDGAVHLRPQTWWDDLSRQNELVIDGSPVLRFCSADIRLSPEHVVDQLRRVKNAHARTEFGPRCAVARRGPDNS